MDGDTIRKNNRRWAPAAAEGEERMSGFRERSDEMMRSKKKWTGKRGLNPALRLGMHAGGPSGPGLIQIDKVMDSL